MIISTPQNEYDLEIARIIETSKDFEKECEGNKSIVYDLVHTVQKAVNIPWDKLNLEVFVSGCYKGFKKHPNSIMLVVVASCINFTFPDLKAKVEGTSYSEQRLVIEKKEAKENVQFQGNN